MCYVMVEEVINGGVVLEFVQLVQLVKLVSQAPVAQPNEGSRRCGL